MDKNMINIDDLIRQRLSGGEEEERSGAWHRMQELLDKEQPVRAGAYFNWKRILSYAAGLVLLAVAGVAGYKATQSKADTDVASVNKYDRANNAMLSDAVVVKNTSDNASYNTSGNSADATDKKDLTRKLIKEGTVVKQSGFVASTGKDASTIAISKTNNNATINKKIPVNATKSTTATNSAAPENQPVNTTVISPVVKASDNNVQVNDNRPNTTVSNNTVAATKRNKMQQLPVEVTNPRYRKQIKTIDSVEVITTKESNRKGMRKVDTIAQGMVATEKFVDAPAEVIAAATATNKAVREILPSATLMERNSPEVINASASLDNKSDKKQSKNAYNPRRFEEMVQNMKVDFGKVSFQPGLVAGISSSVGAYNMMGVQFGVAGIMNISDRWGMFAELKGVYRFGNGKSLINNYNSVDPNGPTYLGNNTYSYGWDSVAHSFNISSSTSIELPIAVKYSANKLSGFAGVNGVYNFAVKVDEYSQKYSRSYVTKSTTAQELTQQWGENTIIGYDAFKARFMLGYVVGAGYQVSPNVGVDLRMTQPFFESNAGTKSSAIVSKQLYRAPSFQLNFTYKFFNNKYKPRELNY